MAAQAGVSLATVSSVLNNKVEARIGFRTQEHVRKIAAELGYRPNHFARSLGRRRTDAIGLMIGDLVNPYFVELMASAEDVALGSGYDVMLDNVFGRRGTRSQGRINHWPVDGVLMWITPDITLEHHLGPSARSLPVVYLGYPRGDEASYVAYDLHAGARAAMEHLFSRGYRKIAFLSPEKDPPAIDEPRRRAYDQVCALAGFAPMRLDFPEGSNALSTAGNRRESAFSAGIEIARMPIGERPDAVFCHNDVVALGLFAALLRSNLRVPEDVAIVGFDGIAEGLTSPKTLTTVRCPVQPMCEKALALLQQIIASQEQGERSQRQILLEPELALGATT